MAAWGAGQGSSPLQERGEALAEAGRGHSLQRLVEETRAALWALKAEPPALLRALSNGMHHSTSGRAAGTAPASPSAGEGSESREVPREVSREDHDAREPGGTREAAGRAEGHEERDAGGRTRGADWWPLNCALRVPASVGSGCARAGGGAGAGA
ncbi:hypothetical protein T484DRAFT_1912936, partial [Baffinella frigidus]